MKFGKSVKFIVQNDDLLEFDISGDVNKLSELVDRINDKSNRIFISGLLANIQASLDSNRV
ncbi:hypothetical protein JXA56_01535 [Candidatus Micrarchaeota archaeon]|nr:hypothetical protein [Candidatus Micrarchaeota archaeon]